MGPAGRRQPSTDVLTVNPHCQRQQPGSRGRDQDGVEGAESQWFAVFDPQFTRDEEQREGDADVDQGERQDVGPYKSNLMFAGFNDHPDGCGEAEPQCVD